MARPTSTSGPSAVLYNNENKHASPPRQRRPVSSQQPGAPAAPNSRQQARPSAQQQQQPSSRRNDRERSTADREREKEDPKTIGPWRIGRTIGKGSSGRVKIAKHSVTGQYAAVKIVPKHALISSRMSINEAGAKVCFVEVCFSWSRDNN